jgi:hypothetical protein
MVEISLSGSGEGLGRVIARGYSTRGVARESGCQVADRAVALGRTEADRPVGGCVAARMRGLSPGRVSVPRRRVRTDGVRAAPDISSGQRDRARTRVADENVG